MPASDKSNQPAECDTAQPFATQDQVTNTKVKPGLGWLRDDLQPAGTPVLCGVHQS